QPPAVPPLPVSFPTRRSSDLASPRFEEPHEARVVSVCPGADVLYKVQLALRVRLNPAPQFTVRNSQRALKTVGRDCEQYVQTDVDRKSTRLNSSHGSISYAVF